MKKKSILVLRAVVLSIFFSAFVLFTGCDDSSSIQTPDDINSDKAAMQQLADQDSAISSFEPNFNEENVMDFLGKVSTEIYPFKVGQVMRLVSRDFSVNIQGDTAYGRVTKTFEGNLLILASYDSAANQPDTLIKKPMTVVITRNVIFVRRANTDNPYNNWRIAAISLPEGGTSSHPNIDLKKITIFLPNGDTLEVNSPNDYYLSRGPGWWRQLPVIPRNETTLIRVELTSSYSEDDFVTLTYGAMGNGLHRAKKRFVLVSSTPNGNVFDKVYEQSYTTHQFPGFFHAIINAFPYFAIKDDSAPVESESWGVPYLVKF
ncbi:MAG: hypothetical protein HXY49_06500 [Ignavibacteriaceae bacterium]|nr:hypothetical protein [Ignavibacteriaceae bacterium]